MNRVEYSDAELAHFVEEFARTRRRQILLTLVMIPVVFLFAFGRGGPDNSILGIPGANSTFLPFSSSWFPRTGTGGARRASGPLEDAGGSTRCSAGSVVSR
jgi:hypothetical protein